VGVALVVAGLLLMLVIVPDMKQFPDDVNTARHYVGTMPVMFDPDTFEFMTDLDLNLERHFNTEATDGGVALVKEEQTMSDGDQVLQHFVKHYALDRKTMEVSDTFPDSWAQTEGFWAREGIVLGWPIGTENRDYVGWSDDYRATVTLKFEGEVEHERAKIKTYYFTSTSGPVPIDPDAVTAMKLSLGLPKEQFQALVEQTDLSPLVKNLLPNVLETLEGDTVPLAYYYEYEGEYWVEPETGVLIDTKKHELRKVGLPDEVIAGSPLALLPEEQRAALRVVVSDFTYWGTDETVQDAKKDAEDAKSRIQLYGTTLPVAGIVVGALLALVGVFLVMRKPAAA
jgi:hypothetical protein